MSRQNKKIKSSLKQQAYEQLSSMFLSGELKPGDPLLEQDLSEQLNISRTPLREAFLQLEKEGIVEIIPRKGAFIKRITLQDVVELFQIREAVEGIAANLASGNLDAETLNLLEDDFDKAQKMSDHENFLIYAEEAGDKLHKLIIDASGNSRIREILKSYQTILIREQQKALNIQNRLYEAFQEHKEILKGLREGPLMAEQAMRTHIRKTLDSIMSHKI